MCRKGTLKMKLLARGLLVALWAVLAQAQMTGTPQLQLNTIYAGADGKFEAAPDTAVLRFNIAAQQDTSRAAYEKASIAADHVRQVLRDNGIDPKVAQLGQYAVQPMYDWKNPKHKVVGYRVTTEVTLKLRDFSKIGTIVGQMADIQDTENQSLNYTLENMEEAKAKASEDALKKARGQANAVATAGGRTLGELLFASVDVNQAPIVPVMAQRMAMAAPNAAPVPPTAEFTPQTITVNAHVNALFALK
jgi:uncharacterized protein YggE